MFNLYIAKGNGWETHFKTAVLAGPMNMRI